MRAPLLRIVAAPLIVGVVLCSSSAISSADPVSVSQARERVVQLQRDAAAAAERVNGAKVDLARSQDRMRLFQGQVDRSRAELAEAQDALEQIAHELYVNGGQPSAVLNFSLDNPDSFLSDLDRLSETGAHQSTLVDKARATMLAMKVTQQALAQERDHFQQVSVNLGVAEADVSKKLAAARGELASAEKAEQERIAAELRAAQERARLEAEAILAQRRAEEQARIAAEQARIAAEQAAVAKATAERQAAADREAAAQAAEQAAQRLAAERATAARQAEAERLAAEGGAPTSAATPAVPAAGTVPTGRAAMVDKAISFALGKVGGTYVWGGEGPDVFDCSGLTMVAWRQAGVTIPHYSGSQYAATKAVSLSAIQPGDLLFFYSVNTHVGMYLGNGKFVHAANSMDGIRIDSLPGYYTANLVAASRPGV